MKKVLTILPFLLILFSFSCTFDALNGTGSIAINLPGTNYSRANTDSIDPELPKEYTVKALTPSGRVIQEVKGAAGSPVFIDNLPEGKIIVSAEGSGIHYGYSGQTEAVIVAGETANALITLRKFLLPFYVKSTPTGEYEDGTEKHPFSSIDMAILQLTDYGGKGVLFIDGSFNEQIETYGCEYINFSKAPKAAKAEITNSNTVMPAGGIYEFVDISFKDSNLTIENNCDFRIGAGTSFTGRSSITLSDSAYITISYPLTSQSAASLNIRGRAGSRVLNPLNSSINIANEYTKFSISNNSNNRYAIGSNGLLIENKPININITNIKGSGRFTCKVKEKNKDEYVVDNFVTDGRSAVITNAEQETFYFNYGSTYIIEIYNEREMLNSKEIVIGDTNNIEISARKIMSADDVSKAIKSDTSKNHDLLVSISNSSDFATLNSGLKELNSKTGMASIELLLENHSVSTIPESAFAGCTNLKEITIPAGITSIKSKAFNGCSNLDAISLPEGLNEIGTNVFSGCTQLSALVIPSSVTSIDDNLAGQNNNISSITTPCNLSFEGNTLLSNITITASTASSVSNKSRIVKNAFKGCSGLYKVRMSGITTLGESCFESCGEIEDIILPYTSDIYVSKVEINAFKNTTIGYDSTPDNPSVGPSGIHASQEVNENNIDFEQVAPPPDPSEPGIPSAGGNSTAITILTRQPEFEYTKLQSSRTRKRKLSRNSNRTTSRHKSTS